MRKTMVYLKDDQFLLLRMVVAASKKKMSEIIRDALSNYLKMVRNKTDYFSFVGIAEGPNKGNTSECAEEILRKELLR